MRPFPWLVLLATAAVFARGLGGAYVYDDVALVVQNGAVQRGDFGALLTAPLFGTEFGYWRPLAAWLLAMGHHLGGAAGIHALVLLLHLGNTAAVATLAQRLGLGASAAAAAALGFAVHPLQAEAVGWCAAANDPLWLALALQGWLAGLRWRDRGGQGLPVAATAWLGAALLAKEHAVVALPLLWGLLAAAPARPGTPAVPPPALPRTAVALAGLLLGWLALRALVFGEPLGGLLRAPAVPPLNAWRLLSGPAASGLRHLGLLVQPWPLSPFRAFAPGATAAAALGWLAGAALALGGAVWLWRRGRPVQRWLLAALLLPLLPVALAWARLGAYPLGDRYLGLPLLAAALWLAQWRPRLPLLLAALAAPLTFVQLGMWHDPAAFASHAVAHHPEDPNAWILRADLALAAAEQGDAAALAAARADYQRALALAPAGSGPGQPTHRAVAAARLGLAWGALLEQGGRRGPGTAALVRAFQAAVDADPSRPAAWNGLGTAHGIAGDAVAAEQAFAAALRLDPQFADAWCNLGYLRLQLGDRTGARQALDRALWCAPAHPRAAALLPQVR